MKSMRVWATVGLLAMGTAVGAKETAIAISDLTGRGFAPDLVQYQLAGSAGDARALRLTDAAGALLPVQVMPVGKEGQGDRTLCFVAEIGPHATASYKLSDVGGAEAVAGVQVDATKEGCELRNGLLALRVPPEGNRTFNPPVPADTLAAPILAFRSGASGWLGGAKILTKRPVKACRVRLATSGPVFADLLYELEWAEGGYYRAQIRVIHRVPVVKVREEYDLKRLDGSDFWELQLATGWAPDRMETAKTHGNGSGIDRGSVKPLAELKDMADVRITPDTCPPSLSQLGLFNEADKKQAPQAYAMAGVVPLHKGDWRKMNALRVESTGPGDVRVRFGMTARNGTWVDDTASETSPFAMVEHEPGLARTYGRRLWGLVLGAPAVPDAAKSTVRYTYFSAAQPVSLLGPFAQARSFYGVIGLDRYKDYVLDWPDTGAKYPRLYNTPGTPAVAEAPPGPTKDLEGLCNAPISCPVISHHLTAGTYVTAAQADATLARPDLAPEVRKLMRARLALIMYLFEEADFISYANGAHSGNPNMGTCRYMGANAFLPLLPDHPMFAKWREHVSGYTEYKMASQIAPGGSYLEFGSSYHMHGYARTTNSLPGLIAAEAPNVKRLYEAYHRPDWDYFMNLLTPVDPRYGVCMHPGLANAGPGQVAHFIEAAGSFARIDPEFAAILTGAWEANGRKPAENPWIVRTDITPVAPQLTSRIFPGFGVIFRAHPGPDETYLLLRSGFDWSHWYIDQGHMVMLSRGAVLLPYQPYAYWDSPQKAELDLYNVIRFGHQKNEFPYDWPDGNVLDHAFGPTVDYAWASTGIPDWFINPAVNPALKNRLPANVVTGMERALSADYKQTEGAFEWNRQILFLKGRGGASPNYFVIRDSMPGAGKLASYLFLNLLGRKDNVKVDGGKVSVATEWPTQLDVRFLTPGAVSPTFFEQDPPLDMHHVGQRSPGTVRDWYKADGKPMAAGEKGRGVEHHVILRIPQEPGAGYTWLLYPRTAAEPEPTVKSGPPGVVQITHAEGTDTVFVAPSHLAYAEGDMVFEGSAGAVRVGKDAVTLVLAGGAGKVGYKGCVFSGIGPFERTLPLAALKAGEQAMPPPPAAAVKTPAAADSASPLAPGLVLQKSADGLEQVLISGAAPVFFRNDRLGIEARRAAIEIGKGAVRFVAPDPTYVKLSVGNVGVRGVGPFDLTLTDTQITGTVAGAMRTLVTTWPTGITKPMFHLDDTRYFAGWADDHCVSKGTATPQFAIAFGVTDGAHAVRLAEWEYPPLPPAPPRRALGARQ